MDLKIGDWHINTPSEFLTGGLNQIWNLIHFLINLLLFSGIVLSLIFLIIGGIRFVVGGGDKEGMAKAKTTITYALIGLVLLLGVFIILGAIQYFFGYISLYLPINFSGGNLDLPQRAPGQRGPF